MAKIKMSGEWRIRTRQAGDANTSQHAGTNDCCCRSLDSDGATVMVPRTVEVVGKGVLYPRLL